MKLSASRFARWFVQGERACISTDQDSLKFKSNDDEEVYSFADWDGRCVIERGLIWGKITLELSPIDKASQKITVYGMPWRKLRRAANELTVEYKNWLVNQRTILDENQDQLIELQNELYEYNGFLRHSDLFYWEQKATKKLKACNLYPQSLQILNPMLYQTFYGWFIDGEQQRSKRNEWWFDRQLQQWQPWFKNIEKSPFNDAQQQAVLMGENHTLLLAAAGSGKTSVLIARCRYLIESEQCQPEQILLVAFGKKATNEMKQRLAKIGLNGINVATFHSFAMRAIEEVMDEKPVISPLATEAKAKKEWMSAWLTSTFEHGPSYKRWLNHLAQWPISGINSKKPLQEQVHKPALHKWLWRHLDILLQHSLPTMALKKMLLDDQQAQSELTLLQPLYNQYQRHLSDRGEYDFHGLIERATDAVSRKTSQVRQQFAHILVDEFQDVSPARMALLEAMCKPDPVRTPSLFAVGDDWQAIYRFAGSDINLTLNFQQRFPTSRVLELNTTYRFNSKIAEVAAPFVLANPKQILRKLTSHKVQSKKAVQLIESAKITEVFAELAKLDQPVSLMLIGRNNNNKPKALAEWQRTWPTIRIEYVTAHASKGLEADYTVILDVNDGVFPAPSKETGLEYMLLTDFEEIEHAEERRLFYVAMTRAKQGCWVCCDPQKPSVFIYELMQDYPVINQLSIAKPAKKKGKKNFLLTHAS